jgi:hypothetical protein
MGTPATPRTQKRTNGSARRHGRRVARLLGLLASESMGSVASASADLADLPWLPRLDREHLKAFLAEYSSAYETAIDTGEWQALDDLVGEWQATAEALGDPELIRMLAQEASPVQDRVRLEYPR